MKLYLNISGRFGSSQLNEQMVNQFKVIEDNITKLIESGNITSVELLNDNDDCEKNP
jgi:hypothetical protein